MAKFVAYYRVSTTKQGRSGLGLDAQKLAVENYVDQMDGELIASFEEIESGGRQDRPKLSQALAHCRVSRAMLVVAKLDRLARNVRFICELMESGVDFIAVDMPQANRLTVHIIAALAEWEKEAISKRTKDSMRVAAMRGVKIGNPKIRELQSKAMARAQEKLDEFARKVQPHFKRHDPDGTLAALKLAVVLTAEGVLSYRGKGWTAATVISMRKRFLRLGRTSQSNVS